MNKRNDGFILPMVLAILLVAAIFIPALVSWIQQDTKQSVKEAKSTAAFNLAEAGVDRGLWKLKSSTATFAAAKTGTVIAGYNFDTTYSDIPGGYYRVKFASGPASRDVTITAEGKDTMSREIRAVKAVYRNQTFGGGLISGGVVTWANAFSAHWGPIMAHGSINITDAAAAQDYFPKKYSRQAVQCTIGSYDRDTNGLALPNTDNTEWWSDYAVPELPILDFATLRSSASATGTLNVYGCSKMSTWPPTSQSPALGTWSGAKWFGKNACNLGTSDHNTLKHFQNSWNHPYARKQYIWYWDEDVIMTGGLADQGHGIWGSVIARKNLTNYAGDNWKYTDSPPAIGSIPANAYEQYTKISKAAGDTSAKNEYPGDDGLRKNRSTFNFGGETWTGGQSPPSSGNTDIGIKGLIYIGGDFNIQGPADVNGVVWVVGNVSKAVGKERTIIFFDDSLDLPTLNVVLVRQSWNEIMPSTQAWP